MGLEVSRAESLPSDIDSKYEFFKNSWRTKKYLEKSVNQQKKYKSTLSKDTLTKAGLAIGQFITDNNLSLSILEVMAGNGVGSKLVFDTITNFNSTSLSAITLWKATDLRDWSDIMSDQINGKISIEFNIDSVDVVIKYGSEYNTLLMISPPPAHFDSHNQTKTETDGGYADYFAIKQWTQLENSKYIIIVGELGASDGSIGMYEYMMKHKVWKLRVRKLLHKSTDIFGGPCEKEIFIFEKELV